MPLPAGTPRGAATAASELAQAEQFYRRLVGEHPRHTEAWFQLGVIALRQARYPAAVEALTLVVSLDPARIQGRHQLAAAYQALGEHERAVAQYAEVVRLKPECAEAYSDWGVALVRHGRFDEAGAAFARAAGLKPDFPEAHNNAGNVHVEKGEFAEALEHFQRAISLRPDYAEAHHNRGFALARLGRLGESAVDFQEAVRCRADYVDAHFRLANVLRDLKRFGEAIQSYRNVLRHRPEHFEARTQLALTLAHQDKLEEAAACLHQGLLFQPQSADTFNNLGVVLAQLEQLDDAVAAFRQALRLRPEFPQAHNNLGHTLLRQRKLDEGIGCFRDAIANQPEYAQAHCNLGGALVDQGQIAEAIACYREAVRLQPDSADAHAGLANAHQKQGELNEAAACCREALRLAPGHGSALLNLGIILAQLGKFDEADTMYNEVLQRDPQSPDAHNSLGVMRLHQGRDDDAVACFDEAIRLRPEAAEMRMNRAMTLLAMGQWEHGWAEYEWRWKQKHAMPRPFQQPLWDGTPMPGGTILLHAEQGLGDSLQFIRFAALVKQRVGTVLVEVPSQLKNLVASCAGVDAVFETGAPLSPFDVHTPFMSLPRLFGTTLNNIPANVPYLYSDVAMRKRWREQLGNSAGLKVGLVWQGNVRYGGDRYRSVPLACFRPLADVPGVRLFSLQKGQGAEQIAALGGAFTVTDVGNQLSADFRDAAALIENMDVVVAVDTMIAHLAGALGKRVWVMVPFHADWRWLRHREDSLWYPTARLFRQQRWGDWDEVIARIAAALGGLQLAAPQRRIVAEVGAGELLEQIAQLELQGNAELATPRKLAAVEVLRQAGIAWTDELAAHIERLKTALAALDHVEKVMGKIDAKQGKNTRATELIHDFVKGRKERASALAAIEAIVKAGPA